MAKIWGIRGHPGDRSAHAVRKPEASGWKGCAHTRLYQKAKEHAKMRLLPAENTTSPKCTQPRYGGTDPIGGYHPLDNACIFRAFYTPSASPRLTSQKPHPHALATDVWVRNASVINTEKEMWDPGASHYARRVPPRTEVPPQPACALCLHFRTLPCYLNARLDAASTSRTRLGPRTTTHSMPHVLQVSAHRASTNMQLTQGAPSAHAPPSKRRVQQAMRQAESTVEVEK
ncbi:hypothetical protein DFH07DRAFT_544928 [Mycena maculata]|uniref:Uncharacterized protein n=1 Tax=Mycena maculata TaxID=230809 RepID=A0AAD7IUG3_9AGAR|nr:hypothetical protein DFH07DRAFT_544928 [Mycena maculata]